jgi:hypothetical protein
MSDDNSKIPAQDMTSTDVDNNESGTEDNSPRVFDITSDLNIAPVKDDVDNNPPVPVNISKDIKEIPITKSETRISIDSNQKIPDIITDKIIIEPEKDAIITEKPQTNDSIKTPVSQFGPANPPAKTVGMNRTNFNENINQQQRIEKEPGNLQEAIAAIKNPIKTTTPSDPMPKVPDRPWEAKPDSKVKPLRTYEIDFAEAMAKKRISSASIAIAEDKKKEREKEVITNQQESKIVPEENIITSYKFPETKENLTNPYKSTDSIPTKPQQGVPATSIQNYPVKEDILKNAQPPKDTLIVKDSHSTRNWFLGIISLILVCGGGYYAFYLYQKSPLAPSPTNNNVSSTSQIERAKSIISPDSKVLMDITGKNQNSIISAIKTEISKPQQEKTIKEIILTESTGETISKVKAEKILQMVGVSTPELFSRSLSDDWMLGVYSGTGEQKSVFIITTNNFFQNTFAGLIQWEKTMPEDLKQYLYSDSNNQDFTIRGQYKDKIIKNKDVREYVTENGHISFLYSFISNDKLVITDSEYALEEIITKLEKDAFIR